VLIVVVAKEIVAASVRPAATGLIGPGSAVPNVATRAPGNGYRLAHWSFHDSGCPKFTGSRRSMSDFAANLQAPRASPFRGLSGLLLGGFVLLLALAYWDAFNGLWNYWIEGYNWQFLIPIAFVYMLRERRDLYAGLTRQPNVPVGTLLLVLACAMLVAGQLSSTHGLRELSMLVTAFALTFLFFGNQYVRRLFWPLAYLGLMLSFRRNCWPRYANLSR